MEIATNVTKKMIFGIHNNQIYSFVQISDQNPVAYITHFRLKMEIVASDFKDLVSCNIFLVSHLIVIFHFTRR
jgi:hypothetical protein